MDLRFNQIKVHTQTIKEGRNQLKWTIKNTMNGMKNQQVKDDKKSKPK